MSWTRRRATKLTLSCAGFVAWGQTLSSIDHLTGRYRFLPAKSDKVEAAIERGIASMSFIARPAARGLLRKRNGVPAEIGISRQGDQLRMERPGRPTITGGWDGRPIPYTPPDGEKTQVSYKLAGGALEETFVAKDGVRTNTFEWSAKDALLYLRVRLTAERLPKPIEYRLAYERLP